jgi:hypothetical protein
MNSSLCLFYQWSAQLRQLLPGVHGQRTKTLAFFAFGLVLSGKARLPVIAEELLAISPANTPSIERRLARFLANEHIAVVPLWTHLLAHLLPAFRDRRLVFVLDATPLDDRACVVCLGLLVQSRLLPVGGLVLPLHETWEERQWSIVGTLLDRVIPYLGTAECTLLADSGLAGLPLVQLCQARQWHYLMGLSAQHTCRPLTGKQAGRWWALRELVSSVGQSWFGPALLWQEHRLEAFLSAVWEPGYQDAWFLLSDQRAGRARVREYARRMRVEIVFSQLTKTEMRTLWGGGDHIADLHLAIEHDHPINQEFHQQAALGKGGLFQACPDLRTERFQSLGDLAELEVLLGQGLQLALLGEDGLLAARQVVAFALKGRQVEHLR